MGWLRADAGAESARPLPVEVTSEPASEVVPEKAESDVAKQDKMADSPPAQKPKDMPVETAPMSAIVNEQTAKLNEAPEGLSASLPQPKPEPATPSDSTIGRIQPEMQKPQVNPEILIGHFVVERTWNQKGRRVGFIRVEIEETLGHYADWLGVTASQIRRLNGFRYGRVLRLNEKIKIPLHLIGKEEFEEKRYEYHKELIEDFFASYRVEKVHTYSVKRGDNIWTLSHEAFEVPLWLLKRYNAHLDFSKLMPSQKIRVPIVEKNA